MAGSEASVRLIPVNTIFLGQCYLIQAIKKDKLGLKVTGLLMNLFGNESVANLYVLPSTEKSEVSAIVDRWNHPIDPIEIRNHNFLKLIMEKVTHVKKSTVGFLCTDLPEENYAKVSFIICIIT